MLPPQRDNSHQHLQTPGDKRSGSGDIKERSVSAHIYRQTDLWWNFKEIIYISPPLNWCMKFSSTMKHTHTHTYTRAQAHKKYILSQINQPELLPCHFSLLVISLPLCFFNRSLPLANHCSHSLILKRPAEITPICSQAEYFTTLQKKRIIGK